MSVELCVLLQLANEVVKYHEHQQELQRLKTIRIAGTIASLVRDFWTRMTEASCTCYHVCMTDSHIIIITISSYRC